MKLRNEKTHRMEEVHFRDILSYKAVPNKTNLFEVIVGDSCTQRTFYTNTEGFNKILSYANVKDFEAELSLQLIYAMSKNKKISATRLREFIVKRIDEHYRPFAYTGAFGI